MPDEPRIEIRAASSAPAVDEATGRPRIAGHFARFGIFNEIDSVAEGRFLERIEPGAFARTFRNNGDRIRMLFQHGRDPQIGDKPIGTPDVLREDKIGPYFEGDLFESVPALIVDGLRDGQYGISYRFSVPADKDDWDHHPARSDVNPLGLPERTIREAKVYEFGPVTFPADHGADYAVRAITFSDLDAAIAPPEQTPALPDAGPEAEPHSDEGTREEPIPVAPPSEENPTVEYVTRDEKASRVTELKTSLAALAVEHPGVLPTDAQTRWDTDTSELDTLERDIRAWDERQARLVAYAADSGKVEPATAPAVIARPSEADIYDLTAVYRNAPEKRDQLLRDNAQRATEQMRFPDERADQDASRQRLANLLDYADSEDKDLARLVLATNSPQYRRDFNRYVKSGGAERGTALAVGVDGTGGYAVPVSFDPTIVAIGAHTAVNPYRASCRVETIVGTDTWQALTATAITAAWALEAAAATEQGPTFARPEYIAKRAHAFVTVSYEMAQDRPSLDADLGKLFGEAKDNLEENSFTLGTGATVYPQGIGLKDAITRVDSAAAAVAVADVLSLEAGVPIRHRMGAAWYLSRAAIRAIQAWETTGGQLFNGTGYPGVGNPVTSPTGNTGLTLLGYPVYETPSMPWTPATTDTTWGVLMNPKSCFVIVDRIGMSIKVIPDMLNGATPSFPTGEIGIYAFWRGTARVLNVDAGRQGAVQ